MQLCSAHQPFKQFYAVFFHLNFAQPINRNGEKSKLYCLRVLSMAVHACHPRRKRPAIVFLSDLHLFAVYLSIVQLATASEYKCDSGHGLSNTQWIQMTRNGNKGTKNVIAQKHVHDPNALSVGSKCINTLQDEKYCGFWIFYGKFNASQSTTKRANLRLLKHRSAARWDA